MQTVALNVLLVEDDPDLREPLTRLLRHEGHNVHAFASGFEVIAYLATWMLQSASDLEEDVEPIDVIVTDVRMPGISGLGVIQGLRSEGWTQPAVIMSAFGDQRLRRQIEQIDDAVFLEKPFPLPTLARTLQTITQRA